MPRRQKNKKINEKATLTISEQADFESSENMMSHDDCDVDATKTNADTRIESNSTKSDPEPEIERQRKLTMAVSSKEHMLNPDNGDSARLDRYDMDASKPGHSHSPPLSHLTMHEMNAYQMYLVIREVKQKLMSDSKLFASATSQELPNFDQHEVQLGEELGRGDFGVVYSVESFTMDSCDCPRCILRNHYNAGMDKRTRNDGQGTSVSTGSGATSSSSSPHTRLQDVAIPEGATDDEEEDEHSSDDLSTASGSSIIIRTGDGSNIVKNLHEYPTVHADANMYTKCYMQRRVTRKGRPRYAVKHLRDFATKRNKFDAAIDLAVEATFLKVLKHPNIVRIRGTVDRPGNDGFMIVMDCLNMTLREKMTTEWNSIMDGPSKKGGRRLRRKNSFRKTSSAAAATLHHSNLKLLNSSGREGRKNWFQKVVNAFMPPNYENDAVLKDLYVEKLMAVYDLARALKFLASKRVLYRDLKPENVGFDVRSRVKLFDFGLSKELKDRDLVELPDSYNATGLTGSRRYMAPEVALCKHYGLASDVYGFAIVFWECFAGEMAYDSMNLNEHFEKVVMNGKRPSTKIPGLSKKLTKLMEDMWAQDPRSRPDFNQICEVLREQSKFLHHDNDENGHHHHLSERTLYLMGQSARSHSNSSKNT